MADLGDIELDELQLHGDRLTLRPWRPDDAPWVLEQLQQPAMATYLPLPRPYTIEAAETYVRTNLESARERSAYCAAMVERATGELVGSCQLRVRRDGELGYWTAPAARGHGYAAEAARLLTAWALDRGLPRVDAECDVRNLASVRVLLAAGMRFEGVTRMGYQGGGRVPAVPELRHDAARFARVAGDPGDAIAPAFADLPGGGLTDGTLALRATTPADAGALTETDDEVSQGWAFYPQTAADIARAVEAMCARAGLDWLVGLTARMSMVDVATGAVAGTISLRRSGPPQVAMIGYGVHPDFRGRGFTARALRLLAPWAFASAGVTRLELGAKVANVASQRAAAAGGFVPDGMRTARLRNADGTMSDEIFFARLHTNESEQSADQATA